MIETEIKRHAQVEQPSVLDGLKRMGVVAGGGVKDATVNALENYTEHVPDAAMGLTMGFGLGAVTKAGKFGPQVAAIAGSVMAMQWAKNELTGNRWNGFGKAMVDAYQSPANMTEDRAVAARSLGSFAVDTAVAVPAFSAGFAGGFKASPAGWGTRAAESLKSGTIELASSLRITEPVYIPQRVAVERSAMGRSGDISLSSSRMIEGRSFSSTDSTSSPFAEAAKLVRGKKSFDGLEGLNAALLESQVGKDTQLVGLKREMEGLLEQNQKIAAEKQTVDQQIRALEKERTEIGALTKETLILENSQLSLQIIIEARQQIGSLQSELARLEPKRGKGESAPQDATTPGGRAQEIRQQLKDMPTEEALTQARAKVTEAKEALAARRATAPEDVAKLTSAIEAATQTREGLIQSGSELTGKITEALKNYKQRSADLKEGRAEVEIAPEQAQVVKTDIQGGKKPMKTADTAGDGIVATAPRPSSSAMVKDFSPPTGASGPEPVRIADVEVKAEPASINADAPAAKSTAVKEVSSPVKSDAAPVAEMNPALTSLSKKMDATFFDAQRHSKAFEFQRSQRQAEREINDIESGRRKFSSAADKERALSTSRDRKMSADASLRDGVPPRYAQTLKKLVDYTKAVEAYYQAEPNSATRDAVMKQAVAKVEELMAPIDNIWNGIPGKTPDLARPGMRVNGERPVWPEERILQIQQHLDAKINTVDNAQAQRIGVVKDNSAFQELLKQHAAGELPKGGSVVFFTDEGTLLYQSELKVSQRSTVARAKDHASAEKHANNTPAFIDVAKIDRGLGPEGAGLWRFIGQENRIVGAAILQPVIKDGKPVELPGAKNRHGEPTIKKEVFRTIGDVPAEVTVNMAYGHMLNMLRAKKATIERGGAPDAVPPADALIGQAGHTGSAAVALTKPEGK